MKKSIYIVAEPLRRAHRTSRTTRVPLSPRLASGAFSKVSRNIAIIGGGHMGTALVRGFLNAGIARRSIKISDDARKNASVAESSDVIFIAVKPRVVREVLVQIRDAAEGKAVISLAAGVRIAEMRKIAGRRVHLGRGMPNIPVAERHGVVGFFGGTLTTPQRASARSILAKLGLLVEVRKERELDALTLISGCGPGIVAALVEMVAKKARSLGLRREADALALHTFMGAIHHMAKTGTTASELMRSVATKGGITEAILEGLRREGFEQRFARAIDAGREKLESIKA